jgi:hypothetical protein
LGGRSEGPKEVGEWKNRVRSCFNIQRKGGERYNCILNKIERWKAIRKKDDRNMKIMNEKEEITLSIISDGSHASNNMKEEYSKCHRENRRCQ